MGADLPVQLPCSKEGNVNRSMIKRGSVLLLAVLLLIGIAGCGEQKGDIQIGNKTPVSYTHLTLPTT